MAGYSRRASAARLFGEGPGPDAVPLPCFAGLKCFEGCLAPSRPTWDQTKPQACGADKEVFIGSYRKRPIAVCVARKGGTTRINMEIRMLKHIGKHPNIATMLWSEILSSGSFLCLEAVEPIGFDLDRLVKQYIFAKQSVPALLSKRLITQLASALKHMHSRQVVHRDVKVENVLVTKDYSAKLIDLGIAVQLGTREERWVWSSKGYMSPETCIGRLPQGPGVDCWGLGVILHQVYQHRWDIIDSSHAEVVLRPNRPCTAEPMADDLKEAMLGLLRFDVANRWTLADAVAKLECDESREANSRGDWQAPPAAEPETRRWLKKYRDSAPPLTAFAAVVDHRNPRLIGKKLGEVDLRFKHGATLLLVDVPADRTKGTARMLEKSPNIDTVIREGAWLYFGFPQSHTSDEALSDLKHELFPHIGGGLGRSVNAKEGMMAFSLEFDCFTFPPHIGKCAAIGPEGDVDVVGLDLRRSFGLNLAGVVRAKSGQPEWFPGPGVVVEPGDLGMVVRVPRRDGTTDPTVTDVNLESLMTAPAFEQVIAERPATTSRRASNSSSTTRVAS